VFNNERPFVRQKGEKAAVDLWQFGKPKWPGVAPLAVIVYAHFFGGEGREAAGGWGWYV